MLLREMVRVERAEERALEKELRGESNRGDLTHLPSWHDRRIGGCVLTGR
jgi:hypothetical protein